MNLPGLSAFRRFLRRLSRAGAREPDFALPEAQAQPPGNPRVFQRNDKGSGRFGAWTLDSAGLPAYEYRLDQYKDVRARYANTEGVDRRDHWHQIGNERVTALASNDGTVQVYVADRGGTFLNRFEAHDSDKTQPGMWVMRIFRRLLGIAIGLYRLFVLNQTLEHWYATTAPRGVIMAEAQPHAPDRERLRELTRHAFAGGFAYLDDGDAVWTSAYRYRPEKAKTRRLFGMGYFEATMTYRDIRLTRRVYAPPGDDAVLLVDAHIENLGARAADLRYYEYWDVNVHQLQLQWVRTGLAAFAGDMARRAVNSRFTPSMTWDESHQALRFHQEPPPDAPPPDRISHIDWAPADVFLADLSGHADDRYTDKAAFFGAGGPRQPEAVLVRRGGEVVAREGEPMPCCMALRRNLRVEPGKSVRLRYAYGAAHPGQPLDFLAPYRTGDPFAHMLDCWKARLAYFSTGRDPVLQREMAWHAYNLLASTVYNAYYDAHVVPQGSAYLFLHGADGAPRDQALFVLPLTYLHPALARDNLRLIMSMRDARTGQIGYAYAGFGVQDGATIHEAPSDLDLFFLLALAEYLAATGDVAFLDAKVPYYPREAPPPAPLGATVLDHVRAAVKHLMEGIGVGAHGLIRISDGDWSDGVVISNALQKGGALKFAAWFENTKARGESVPNTQMALYVLPLIAAQLEAHDADLAARLRAWLPGLREAVNRQWTGRWYTRAVLRDAADRPVIIGRDDIELEAQPWPLISGLAAEEGTEAALVESVRALLDDPSPIGATLIAKDGMVWPAVSQLLTWGYTRAYPDLAWRSLKRHLFAAHAHVFPNVWVNIWTGPDGVNAVGAPNAGGAWASPVTPMTDFPALNMNQHAMALLGLLRVCGIEPAPEGDGLRIAPCVPGERFALDLPLLTLEGAPGRISGVYRACAEGRRVLHVRVPDAAAGITARVNGQPAAEATHKPGEVALTLTFTAGQAVPFEVAWRTRR